MKKMLIAILFLFVSVSQARSEILFRWPIDVYYGYTSWFDHDPLVGPMRRYDGATDKPRDGHHGTDIWGNNNTGLIVRAAALGNWYFYEGGCAYTSPGCGSGYGNHFRIEHASGKVSIYAHLQPYAIVLWQNPTVCGRFLGYMGTSGNSTGIHLHFEQRSSKSLSSYVKMDPFGGPWSNGGFSYWVNQNGAGTGNPSTQCQ